MYPGYDLERFEEWKLSGFWAGVYETGMEAETEGGREEGNQS